MISRSFKPCTEHPSRTSTTHSSASRSGSWSRNHGKIFLENSLLVTDPRLVLVAVVPVFFRGFDTIFICVEGGGEGDGRVRPVRGITIWGTNKRVEIPLGL